MKKVIDKIKILKTKAGSAKSKFKTTFLEKIKNIKLNKKIVLALVVIIFPVSILIFLLLSGLLIKIIKPNPEITTEVKAFGNLNIENIEKIAIANPPVFKSKTNPINGMPISETTYNEMKNKKVFTVVINNHEHARSQNGLSEADMVMEVLAEGGITRYVGVFYENEPEKIGPVRSLRRYMIDFMAEFDSPVVLHEGWATFNSGNKVYVRSVDAAADVAQFKIKSMQSAQSRYRDLAKADKDGYVHSLYTGYQLIENEFDRYSKLVGWENTSNFEELIWKYDDPLELRGKGGKIDISFLSHADSFSRSGFIYNPNTNSYDRTIVGKPDIDLGTNEQISPKNVVVEWHDFGNANDGYARIFIDMIGQDEAVIYRDGKEIKGTWKKTDRTARTRYYNESGEEIELNRGQIWKVIVVKIGNTKYSKVTYTENE